MYSAAFIFELGEMDSEFHALSKLIQEAAESMEGYVGVEFWRSMDGKKINSTYYWDSEAALHEFSAHPKHLEAKKQYTKWYKGYHVVVSEVQRSYGDNTITHATPNDRLENA